jgi:hypothetical protein
MADSAGGMASRSGNPSTEALGAWAPCDAKTRPAMIFDRTCRIENDPRGELRGVMLSFRSQQYAERESRPSSQLGWFMKPLLRTRAHTPGRSAS